MNRNTVTPRILVIEGLYGDTAAILTAAGASVDEVYPWDYADVEDALRFGAYDGMVLTGGGDVDPTLYHEKPHKETYGIDQLRDTVEMMALSYALEQGISVLGICRGSQLMAVSRGGKLTQHIEGHRGFDHKACSEPDARTFRRAIGSREIHAISLHHQCIRRPGKGMRIAARAMDGTPEAIESKDGLWLGVQFHPEMSAFTNGNAFSIFKWLVQSSATHAGGIPVHVNFRDVRPPPVRTWVSESSIRAAITDETSMFAQSYRSGNATEIVKAKPKHRVAGGRTFIADGHEPAEALYVCGACATLFDSVHDRDDHETYIHGMHEGDPDNVGPPVGHAAWEMS